MGTCLLEACGITKIYGTVVKTKALQGIDLEVHKGDFASLIGYSGSGKTTLLNILGALDRPTEGTIRFQGRDLTTMSGDELAFFRNSNLGFIFQFHHLLPEFSVLENVLIPTWIQEGRTTGKKELRAKELLELVGLQDVLKKKATEISGGQQQRVAIARALINDPALILADEPTGNLDSETTDQVYSLMRNINDQMGTAFLVVTHNDHIAAKSDRVIEMKDGRITRDYLTAGRDEDQVWLDVAPAYCKLCEKGSSALR